MKIPLLLLGLILLSNTTLLNLDFFKLARDFSQPTKTVQSSFNGGIIVNGDFSSNSCPASHDFCIYTDRNSVPGWIPDPQL